MLCGFRHLSPCLVVLLCNAFWGCSVQLTRGDTEKKVDPDTKAQSAEALLFRHIPLIVGTDTLWLEQDLLFSYNSAVTQSAYPQPQCQGSAQVLANVRQNGQTGAESIPLVIFPFWPIQPVDETWTYKLSAQIHCEGAIVKQVEFTEEETIQATLYGKLRSDLLNQASKEMHRKLAHRLAFELDYRYNADLNSVSDY